VSVFLLGIFLSFGFYFSLPSRTDPLEQPNYGFVNLKAIFRSSDVFGELRREWERDKVILGQRYERTFRQLREQFERAGFPFPSPETSTAHSTKHHHATQELKEAVKTPARQQRLTVKLETWRARRRRAQQLIERNRRELVKAGRRNIQKTIATIAKSKNIKTVYRKPELIYQSKTMNSKSKSHSLFHNLTQEVIRRLKTDRQDFIEP
jgi:Skp family chaperone for outer membrane proteins